MSDIDEFMMKWCGSACANVSALGTATVSVALLVATVTGSLMPLRTKASEMMPIVRLAVLNEAVTSSVVGTSWLPLDLTRLAVLGVTVTGSLVAVSV